MFQVCLVTSPMLRINRQNCSKITIIMNIDAISCPANCIFCTTKPLNLLFQSNYSFPYGSFCFSQLHEGNTFFVITYRTFLIAHSFIYFSQQQ